MVFLGVKEEDTTSKAMTGLKPAKLSKSLFLTSVLGYPALAPGTDDVYVEPEITLIFDYDLVKIANEHRCRSLGQRSHPHLGD